MPFIIGATTPITAFVAIAASTAFPPEPRIAAPAWAANGLSAATMPPRDITTERPCVRSCEGAIRWIECDETLDFLLVARSCTKRPAKLLAGRLRLKTGPYGRRAFAALESISPYFLGRDSGG